MASTQQGRLAITLLTLALGMALAFVLFFPIKSHVGEQIEKQRALAEAARANALQDAPAQP